MNKIKILITISTIYLSTTLLAEENKEYLVTAPTGLILRSKPNMNSNKITTIPFGETVKRNNKFSIEDSKPYFEFYDNKMSYDYKYHGESSWYKIEYQNFEGFAYGFFLVEKNSKNFNFFTYNEKKDDFEIKRNFINFKSENGNVIKRIFSQVYYENTLLFQMESPIILNETAFIRENFLYFEKPLTHREAMGYQGILFPLFYRRYMRLDLKNKKNLIEKIEIIASPETSIMNNQLFIQIKERKTSSMKVDLPEKQEPIFFFNDKKIKVSSEISESFKCLNKNKYFNNKSEDSFHTDSNLIFVSLEENIDNIENQKLKINICDKPMTLDFLNYRIE
ncbi:SH3 domain-containing protein [Leptospira sp. 2 VSF19]|uniref:SH3 domain-containing protein n=1 Tax=Leptospira soteropolitanensis TaxID=2950025 RepID=A0AAW5VS25_9LEPT|nr:SH3 domain-containing protein [Leptospira soteropolitanensis]MCW7494804.1 SH3 domain-containing protein [Leptospira soteropolitanensis]MCW7502416.1 SH3 domain-containing protein [Leptospira soteropolitanensis]MCW7524631.1 SH3 domain-containing protein [Leptospira soteropolitanensis]MCW7528502.1 SH3 domain-containing protein [Leptospira soteropolitanensis]MCW7532388.1 SH3 domain-containing protein [Leptospira soteropolitanensis]